MGVSLKKGEGLSLSKAAADAGKKLVKLYAGAGWDPAQEGAEIDFDLMAVLLDANGKALADANGNGTNADEAVLAYFNLKVKGAEHTGDNLTGDGDGDDERINFTLADLPAEVKSIAVLITSYSGQKFGEAKNAFVRVVNADGDEELGKYELTTDDSLKETKSVEMGVLTREGDDWSFQATGKALAGEPKAALESYGVSGLND